MAKKTALITGITGQDGSYLAELLLEEGYRVVGMTRRTSTDVHERIRHLAERIEFCSGDLLDQSSMTAIVADVRPTEIYNLAAQSFVPASFSQPVLTGEFTALGVTRVLEAVRAVDPSIRFYQASSSEMFGKVQTVPQNEQTPFYPRSPYGVAKLYGHWITVNYRESYDLFAASGILFNHESVPGQTPVIVRRDGLIDVVPIEELVPVREHGAKNQDVTISGCEVWDGEAFVAVLGGSAYRHRPVVDNKGVRRIEAPCGTVTTTREHVVFLEADERAAGTVAAGDIMRRAAFPDVPTSATLDVQTAWTLGAFLGGGSESRESRGYLRGYLTHTSSGDVRTSRDSFNHRRSRAMDAATSPNRIASDATSSTRIASAAMNSTRIASAASESHDSFSLPALHAIGSLALEDVSTDLAWLPNECSTNSGQKRVPRLVLNAGVECWRAFLDGYRAADRLADDETCRGVSDRHCVAGGLAAADAASGATHFKTTHLRADSPVLAMGLWWMAKHVLDQAAALAVEISDAERDGPVYTITLVSPNSPNTSGVIGARASESPAQVTRVVEQPRFAGWLYDITTASGRFSAGVGDLMIHNSPRRGKEFVTRKISDGVARIKLGIAGQLLLGNLDAQRDWGFAGDYVRAMWLMLQQEKPDDYVVSTGRTHYVRDFVRLAFSAVDLNYEDYVKVDPRFYRPAEVDLLIGDPAKARRVLGWEPTVSFEVLVERMVAEDMARLRPFVAL